MKLLLIGQPGYENLLLREAQEVLGATGAPPDEDSGFVECEVAQGELEASLVDTLCFPHLIVRDPVEVTGNSVNALAAGLLDGLLENLRDVRVEGAWPLVMIGRAGRDSLGRRIGSVRQTFLQRLKERMSRVAKLAADPQGPGEARGWAVFFEDFSRVLAGSHLHIGGQKRMADDPAAPSRSFLKVEEAYQVLGFSPREGERVVDLGAAPGGWSFSAARRGAQVDAVDNGPLKAGAADNPQIVHLREDGFTFSPGNDGCDWLFCDMVEDPFRVLRLLEKWVAAEWCQHFVVNLKFGRADPIALLGEVREWRRGISADWPLVRARHLFHDREELTLVGSRTPRLDSAEDSKQ